MLAVINIVSLILDNFVKNRRERKGGLQRKRKSNTVRPIIPIFFDAFAASFPVFFDAISACFTSRTYFISLILRLIFLSNGEQVYCCILHILLVLRSAFYISLNLILFLFHDLYNFVLRYRRSLLKYQPVLWTEKRMDSVRFATGYETRRTTLSETEIRRESRMWWNSRVGIHCVWGILLKSRELHFCISKSRWMFNPFYLYSSADVSLLMYCYIASVTYVLHEFSMNLQNTAYVCIADRGTIDERQL